MFIHKGTRNSSSIFEVLMSQSTVCSSKNSTTYDIFTGLAILGLKNGFDKTVSRCVFGFLYTVQEEGVSDYYLVYNSAFLMPCSYRLLSKLLNKNHKSLKYLPG